MIKRQEEIALLLESWKAKRAARVTCVLARYGFAVAIVSTAIDIFFLMPALVISGDIVFLAGTSVSIYATKQKNTPWWAWIPLYTSLWYAITTSLFETGGIQSPFVGSYFSLLFVAGLAIQVQLRPLISVIFIFLNLIFWFLTYYWFSGNLGTEPPVIFSFLINLMVMSGFIVCIYEFLRTERTLAEEIFDRYQELEITRENLTREEAANVAKSNFLANISHELRTPLGAILGYSELALDSGTDPLERADFIETIRSNGNQLLHLVNDLLDLTKVEAGKIEIEKITFDPTKAIIEVIDMLNMSARKKGLEIELQFLSDIPQYICSDPTRFKQILMNIIGNAVKFSDHGLITVTTNCLPIGGLTRGTTLQIEVSDTGPGLTRDEQARLFKPFSQADASVSRKYGGTGLGLNLSRHLARLLDGDLELAWSQAGSGSRFLFKLPVPLVLTEESSPARKIEFSDKLPLHFPNCRILIVEDNHDNQILVSRYLKQTEARIDIASDGLEALQQAAKISYDLILMDVQMPIMDGLQATKLLRQKNFRKPIIALTAHAMKEDRDRCMAAGFDDYLTKPVDRNLLQQKIQYYLYSHNNTLDL